MINKCTSLLWAVMHYVYKELESSELLQDRFLKKAADLPFYNTSPMDLSKLGETQILENLDTYIQSPNPEVREISEKFDFHALLERLDEANLLYKVVQHFASTDLSPDTHDNMTMGLIFEELIRRFAESSNQTTGEHFILREIVRLTIALIFTDQQEKIAPGKILAVRDPTAGTGGFLLARQESDNTFSFASDHKYDQSRKIFFHPQFAPHVYFHRNLLSCFNLIEGRNKCA